MKEKSTNGLSRALFTICVCVLITKGSAATPSPSCQYQAIADAAFQNCISILGVLNTTQLTDGDKCSYYAESIYCGQKASQASGGQCSVSDIAYWYKLTNVLGIADRFSHCSVEPETTGLCTDDRLAKFALTSCQNYLAQMALTKCMLIDYLLNCVKSYLGYVDTSCSDAQIHAALTSPAAQAWTQAHHLSLDLRTCFSVPGSPQTTMDPHTSSKCIAVYDMFTNSDVIGCIYFLRDVNLTENNASIPRKNGCSLINEALVCMQKRLSASRTVCTIQQLHDTLARMLHVQELLGPGVSDFVMSCAVNTTYASSSICTDNFRLMTYLANKMAAIFHLVQGYNIQSTACTTIASSSNLVLQSINVTCPINDVWTTLMSAVGQSQLAVIAPTLDVGVCVNTSGTTPEVTGSTTRSMAGKQMALT